MRPFSLQRLFGELKRRKVFRAAGAYLVMGWVAIEVAETLSPLIGLPDWVPRLVLLLVFLGFPIAVGLAWAVDITEGGVRRTGSQDDAAKEEFTVRKPLRRRSNFGVLVLIGTGVLVAILLGSWYLLGSGDERSSAIDRSIAVLPFETLGTDDASAFTDGVHSGILTRLAGVSDLDVISRTSVMGYRSALVPLPQIASQLDIAWAVRGEVQEIDGQVLVNARLLNAREDRQVWAEGYRRELTADNVFRIQSDIATAVLAELQARLTPGEEERVGRAPTSSLEAYRLYVQGRSYLDSRTVDGMRQSIDFFRQAIARDSSYALPWVGIADALTLLYDYGYQRSESALRRAHDAVARALDLDPRLAEAHASRGLLASTNRQAGVAIRELRRAVELRPSYGEAHTWLAWISLMVNDENQALASALRAVELDPLAPEAVGNLVLSHIAQGQFERALQESQRVFELQPDLPEANFYTALALYELDRADEAKPILEGLVVPWAGSGPALTLALAHVATGDITLARRMRARFEAEGDWFPVAVVSAALGEVDAAFVAFGRVESWSEYWPTLAGHHLYRDVLGPIREDPRFAKVARRLANAWNTVSE